MASDETFFLPGPASDPAYLNVRDARDAQILIDAREFTESLWPSYKHLADPNFRSDAMNHFLERFWEMYLACTLVSRGFDLQRTGNEGPEFYFVCEGRKVWVEAVTPGPGTGQDRVPDVRPGEAYDVPTDKILLRFTSVIREKRKKLALDMQKGIVKADEPVLLAINSRGIPHAPYGAELPYIVKAVFPIGGYTVAINTQTRQITDRFHQYRPEVKKENSARVATTALLDAHADSFCAVLHSSVDCANHPSSLGDDFLVLHNSATSPKLPARLFEWCRQFKFIDNVLHDLPAQTGV